MNYNRFLNSVSLARQPSILRLLTQLKIQSPPSLISMATGMPNVDLFPFKDCQITLGDGSKLEINTDSMKQALQYSQTAGLPGLLKWVKGHQKEVHNPPLMSVPDPEDPRRTEVIITSGSQDGFCKAVEAMVTRGDNVLMEELLYPGTTIAVKPLGPNILSVRCDKDGMDPVSLKGILAKWTPTDAKNHSSGIPRILHCVPNGGNPTGHTMTLQRKQEIYQIAQKYDLIILEDDPYFYLQFEKPLVPSFLSLDTDGRVLRFDSFSKLLSSGMRVGFVTGPKAILDRITLHMQASVIHCSALSQMFLLKLLEQIGLEGFSQHVEKVAEFYKDRRDVCLKAAEKHLSELAEWFPPSAGMFLWIKIKGVPDTYRIIMEKAFEKEVLFAPGNAFRVDSCAPSSHIRASYSLATPQQMDLAFERLAAVIREELKNG